MYKKKWALLLAGMMLVGSMTGCGGTSEKTDKAPTGEEVTDEGATGEGVTDAAEDASATDSEETDVADNAVSGKITIWVWTDISDEITAYENSHPGTEIEQVVVAAGDYITKIQTTITSGGELPDLLWGEILTRGQIYDMDILDDLSGAPYYFDTSLVDESLIQTMKNEAGVLVGIDRNVTPSGIAYHRELAEQYLGTGDPAEVQAMFPDWDSFIEAGRKVKTDSDGKITMFTSLGDVYYILNGQSDTARISNGVINRAAVLELFTNICKFRDAGIVSQIEQWTPAWYASFGGSDSMFAAMPCYGIKEWIVPNTEGESDDWALIIPPEGGFSWGGTAWSVTKDCKNKELAWDFMQHDLFGEGCEIRREKGELASGTGYLTEEALAAEDSYFAGQQTTKVYIEEILPTIETVTPTKYDYADICTMEVVLSSLNQDYDMTAEEAVDAYITEMQNQAPELTVE